MSQRSLGFLAILIIVLMGVVLLAGLDNLPGDVRAAVTGEQQALTAARRQFDEDSIHVRRALENEPQLFRRQAGEWPSRLQAARARLDAAARDMDELSALAQANRRTDADRARQLLQKVRELRAPPVAEAASLRAEADRWLRYKRELPARVARMERDYQAVVAFSLNDVAARVDRAALDWPAKRDDLNARLEQLRELQNRARAAWAGTAGLRAQAERRDVENFDYATLFQQAETLERIAGDLPAGAATITTLAGQLYESWDRILLDLEGDRRKVRIVRTRYPDATLQNGVVSHEERWEPVDGDTRRRLERNLGMVVARKAAGRYENEVDETAQPPAFAYVAPPGQANQYGSWSQGVWSFFPQYLLLSQLMNMGQRSITADDYRQWESARRRGETWYGRERDGSPRWGTTGSWTRRDYGDSRHLRRALERAAEAYRGGAGQPRRRDPEYRDPSQRRPSIPAWGESRYRGSKYESRGTFAGSRYQTRGGFSSGSGTFGSRSYSRGFSGGGRGGRR